MYALAYTSPVIRPAVYSRMRWRVIVCISTSNEPVPSREPVVTSAISIVVTILNPSRYYVVLQPTLSTHLESAEEVLQLEIQEQIRSLG